MNHYTYIVIGNGLVGSAAGRYLSEWSDSVAVIGPGEPEDHKNHDGVYASHYDQGRLTHEHSRDPVWGPVAKMAVAKYGMLEEKSGVKFHGPTGRVHASRQSKEDAAALQAWMAEVDPEGKALRYWAHDDKSWQDEFPFLDFAEGYDLFHEAAPAGYVNPRSMLKAQNVIAQQNGATVVAERVIDVQSGEDKVVVKTESGGVFSAEKVLIACGSFTNFSNLLPEAIPLRMKTESMVWGTVDDAVAENLAKMPGVGYDINDPDIDDIYMAPPIKYPDGTYKIKMGCNTANELWPTSLKEIQAWFQGDEADIDKAPMERAMRGILPEVTFSEVVAKPCLVTYTPSGYPTIDQVPSDTNGRIYVATGGNGSGAQGSDTLGHAAAGLMHDGRWIDDLPRDVFLATHTWEAGSKGDGKLSKAQLRAAGMS